MIAIMSDDLELFLRSLPGREFSLAAQERVFLQGDPVQQMFFVAVGTVHLMRHQESGAPLVLHRAGAGALLAEASLYADKYHCYAVTVAPSRLWTVSKRDLLQRMAQSPELSLVIIGRLAHELQHARFHAEMLSMKTVAARVDAWIGWNGPLPPKGEWVELAAELGVSPEALYREIARRR